MEQSQPQPQSPAVPPSEPSKPSPIQQPVLSPSSSKKPSQPSHLSKAPQIQPPMAVQKPKFQPTPVGIIYEEISLLDAFDDASGATDFPSLFESSLATFTQYSNPVSESVLELQAKPETRGVKPASGTKKRSENVNNNYPAIKKRDLVLQNPAPISTKDSTGKQFKFDEKKAAPYLHSTKLKNFLVHAGGTSANPKNLVRVDPLAGSFNNPAAMIITGHNNASKKDQNVRTSAKLSELLSGHQTTHHNPAAAVSKGFAGNLPLLKPASQPKKDLLKTSYSPFFNPGTVGTEPLKLEEIQQSNDHNAANKVRRPKSGENTTAALKKIYVGAKEKVRKYVWNTPGVNAA